MNRVSYSLEGGLARMSTPANEVKGKVPSPSCGAPNQCQKLYGIGVASAFEPLIYGTLPLLDKVDLQLVVSEW